MPSSFNFLAGVLSAKGAGTAGTVFEPQRANSAMLSIVSLESIPGMPPNSAGYLELAIQSFSLPKVQTNVNVIPYLNEVRKFAGRTDYSNVNVSFHDFIDRKTVDILWAWKNYIHDPATGIRGVKSRYAKAGTISVYPPDTGINGEVTETGGGRVMRYTLVNIWPVSVDFGDIDMGSDEPVRVGVQFEIDKVYPNFVQ
jgi:hypothetical protein